MSLLRDLVMIGPRYVVQALELLEEQRKVNESSGWFLQTCYNPFFDIKKRIKMELDKDVPDKNKLDEYNRNVDNLIERLLKEWCSFHVNVRELMSLLLENANILTRSWW